MFLDLCLEHQSHFPASAGDKVLGYVVEESVLVTCMCSSLPLSCSFLPILLKELAQLCTKIHFSLEYIRRKADIALQ